MSDKDYIYAGASATLATYQLLSTNQRELLLNTKSVDELCDVLRETYFARYVSGVPLPNALDAALQEVKQNMQRIESSGDTARLFFLRYDYENAAHIVQSLENASLSPEEVLETCSPFGMYTPARMYAAISEGKLHALDARIVETAREAEKQYKSMTQQYGAHVVFERGYIQHAQAIANEAKDTTLQTYTALQTDIYNVRALLLTEDKKLFVSGGTIEVRHMQLQDIAIALSLHDNSIQWVRIMTEYTDTNDHSAIDRALDDYQTKLLKRAAIDRQSLAPVLLYLHAFIENVQYIRTLYTAHTVGLSTETLRNLIRTPALSYAY